MRESLNIKQSEFKQSKDLLGKAESARNKLSLEGSAAVADATQPSKKTQK
jgi:hypothetical protein